MEPERRIEKLLRAFAKKRREQAGDPAALRPAARQRLQQEISRRSAAKSAGGFLANLFSTFQPRLAFALCSLAILVIGGWLLLPLLTGRKPPTLAAANTMSAKTSSKEKVATPPTLAPPPETTPALASDKDSRTADASVAALTPAQPSEAPANSPTISSTIGSAKQVNMAENGVAQTNSITGITVASAPSPARQAFKTESVAADSFSGASTLNKDVADHAVQPTPAPVKPAPVTAPILAESDQVKKLETQKQPAPPAATSAAFYNLAKVKATAELPVASQNFNRMEPAADGKRALGLLSVPAPVLASFRLEQNGNDLRVVDADGSVYTGVMQMAREEIPAATFSAPPKIKPSAPPPVKASTPSAAQNYYFTVAGTNRNLNQNVVFSGNLIPFTNTLHPRSNVGGFGGAMPAARAAPAMPEPWSLSNSRISGKAVIGNEKEIEVNATPAP
jgi:hypothetical protein